MLLISRKSLLLSLMMVSATAMSVGCTDSEDPIEETPPGTVTINVVSDLDTRTPLAGAIVAFNNEDGSLIESASGVTDANGAFVAQNIPVGASVTVAGESDMTNKVLQTTHDLMPGNAYQFYIPQYSGVSPTVGTVVVTLANTGGMGENGFNISAGGCAGGPISPTTYVISLTQDCLQSDGKVTVFGFGYISPSPTPVTFAVAADLAPVPGGTLNVTLDAWNVENRSLDFTMNNAPGEMNFAGSLAPASVQVLFQRKGIEYGFNAQNFGMASGTIFSGAKWKYPAALPELTGGKGILMSFASQFKMPDGSLQMGGFVLQTASPSTPWVFDLAQALSKMDITNTSADITDLARTSVSWTSPASGNFDAAVTGASWNSGGNYLTWLATSRHTRGMVQIPELPASMSAYLPPAGGSLQGPLLFLVDNSWNDGYESYVARESGHSVIRMRIDALNQAGTRKFALTIPSTVAFKTTGSATRMNEVVQMRERLNQLGRRSK